MNRRLMILCGLLLMVGLVAGPVQAGSIIDLKQSDNRTTTPLGGTGDKAKVIFDTIAGEAVADDVMKVEQRGYYTSITTATTTVVKSGPGWFQGCKVFGGTLGNITIYDNTAASGAVIVAAFTPTASGDLFPLNTSFSVGLTVVTASATNLTCVVR